MRSGGIFDFDARKEELEEVNRELEQPDVWNDQERAQKLGQDRARLEAIVLTIVNLNNGLADAAELLEMAVEENDEDSITSVVNDLDVMEKAIEELEFRRMFSGEMDQANAFLDIQSGSGGTEAQDWAEMILRMYLRWGEAHGFKTELIEVSAVMWRVLKALPFVLKGSMPMAGYVPKPVYIAWFENHPLIPAIVVILPLRRCLYPRKWMMISKSILTRRIYALMFTVHQVPVDST